MNIGFGKRDFDISFMEAFVDCVVELALHPGKALG